MGVGAGVNFTDTWEWDGSQWLQVADSAPTHCFRPPWRSTGGVSCFLAAPSCSSFLAMAVWTHTFIPYGETWEWDGKLWVERRDFGPGARVDHAMSYDSARKVIVMFGGTGDASGNPLQARFGDTWEPFDREPIPDSG